MIYEVIIEKPVIVFLQKHKEIAERFFAKVELIEQGKYDLLDTKPLKGYKDSYRLRIGKYRFLFRKDKQRIIIYFYDADSRGDIY